MGSTIVILYNGTDITDSVLYEQTRFEGQVAAVPGTFELTVKDPNRTLEFITGKEISLSVDGVKLFGGYVMSVSRAYAFPADDTSVLSAVRSRIWVLRGVDYNIILDKRILRNDVTFTERVPDTGTTAIFDGAVVRTYLDDWFDLPAGFDHTSTARIEDTYEFTTGFTWPTPGTTLRGTLELLAQWGSVFYVDGDMQLHFKSVESTAAPWGLSDKPNGTTRIGFKDGEYIEDATAVVNDAFVWGGSEWANNGAVVFARRENATSISNHNRWQLAEVHLGETGFKTQTGVTARANIIVDGDASGTGSTGTKGLVNPEAQFRATWFGHDVPSNNHLKPGDVTPIDLWVFSEDGGTTPYSVDLPLRSVNVSFPALEADGSAVVQFEGFFGIQNSDPYWLWDFLKQNPRNQIFVNAASNSDTSVPPYGTMYADLASPTPNGSTTVFTIPWGYIAGTLAVYLDGYLKIPGTHYTESDPAAGEFTMNTAPPGSSTLYVQARLLGA